MIPLANYWKHWVIENWVKNLNTKYRKHHRTSFDEFIVTHQSSTIERRRLSEIREIVQSSNWEETPSNSSKSESEVSDTNLLHKLSETLNPMNLWYCSNEEERPFIQTIKGSLSNSSSFWSPTKKIGDEAIKGNQTHCTLKTPIKNGIKLGK